MINSRRKGAAYQAALAKRWRDLGLWLGAHSTQGSQGRRVGAEPSDIGGTPYVVECKDQIRPNVWKAMEQAEAASSDDKTCIVVAHKKGDKKDAALVCMRLSDWEALVARGQGR